MPHVHESTRLPADVGSSSLFLIWDVRLWMRAYTLSQVFTGLCMTSMELTRDGLPVGANCTDHRLTCSRSIQTCICPACSSVEHPGLELKRSSLNRKYLLIVILCKVLVLLHNFMQSGLHLLLTVRQRVAVTVQQTVHVGTLHHLDQDGSQLPF